jgi:hypothetical protein
MTPRKMMCERNILENHFSIQNTRLKNNFLNPKNHQNQKF